MLENLVTSFNSNGKMESQWQFLRFIGKHYSYSVNTYSYSEIFLSTVNNFLSFKNDASTKI